jgi:transposase
MSKITLIGLDLAKSAFSGSWRGCGRPHYPKKQLTRARLADLFARLDPCVVAMEACSRAHHWARKLLALGHEPQLIQPQYVKPFVGTNKNDAANAEAITTAVQ